MSRPSPAALFVSLMILGCGTPSQPRGLPENQDARPDESAAIPATEPERKADQDRAGRPARDERPRAEYERAMADGRAKLKARNYQAAADSFTKALGAAPGDKEAAARRDDAEFEALVERGRAGLAARPGEAVAAFEAAAKRRPMDAAVADLLRQAREAERRKREAQAGSEADAKERDFQRHVSLGRSALAGARLMDAQREFREAKRLKPADPEVGQLLNMAETKKRDYDRQLADAKSALMGGRFADAERAAQGALRVVPGDGEATRVLGNARAKRKF